MSKNFKKGVRIVLSLKCAGKTIDIFDEWMDPDNPVEIELPPVGSSYGERAILTVTIYERLQHQLKEMDEKDAWLPA